MSEQIKREIDTEEIYQDIALQYKLPLTLVKKACQHQFKMMSNMIYENNDNILKLPYIGKVQKKTSRR